MFCFNQATFFSSAVSLLLLVAAYFQHKKNILNTDDCVNFSVFDMGRTIYKNRLS